MQLEAIYNQGRLEFIHPVRFAHNHFRVQVDVPEQEIIGPASKAPEAPLSEYAAQWLARLETIKQEVLQTPEDHLPIVSEKQLERLRAIEMREDR